MAGGVCSWADWAEVFLFVRAEFARVGMREGDWWTIGCCGIMRPVKLLVGVDCFHSVCYVGKGEVWWCE